MKKRVFIDMDGTLYRFHDHILDESGHVQIEKMYELDFFVKLESFENMKEAINLLHSVDKEEIEIFILSSADTKEVVHQKNICIDRDFPFIDEEHRLFPKTWESKTDKIPEGIYVGDILIDDYNVNLEQWKERTSSMSKEIRELEENSKRIIENMRPQTIAQYHIKQWLDDNFIMGCARLEYTGKDTAKVMDTVGGVMYVEYKNGEVRECQK